MSSVVNLKTLVVFAMCALVPLALPTHAVPADGPVANVQLGATHVAWTPLNDYAGLSLVISGPNGVDRLEFGPDESPHFDLAALAGDVDGLYNWELRAAPRLDDATRHLLAASRVEDGGGLRHRPAGLPPADQLVQSGTFRVVAGAVVQPTVEAAPELVPQAAGPGRTAGEFGVVTGETVISGDLTVYNSICAGFDCLSNETYGADTIRLKENNLRIHVDDTSTAGSYPRTDWRIEFNSNLNGGGSWFRVQDASANRNIFTLEANAPNHSLYVDDGGRVGMGTQTPSVELHVVDGDTPTLRLAQDTSSGFAAQTWDMAGNETSFFVRDTTNGSTLPFRIFPGESSNALVIRNDGIGIGTTSPAAPVHIVRADRPGFMLEDNNGTGASQWEFELNANGLFQVNKTGSGGAEVLIRERQDPGGLETMDVDGSIEADAFNLSSSRTFKTGFEPVDASSVLARVIELPVAHWTFKWDEQGTRHIGPMAEDFLALFGVGNDSRSISVGDVSGVALAAIQGLHRELEQRDARIVELEQRLATLEMQLEGAADGDESP